MMHIKINKNVQKHFQEAPNADFMDDLGIAVSELVLVTAAAFISILILWGLTGSSVWCRSRAKKRCESGFGTFYVYCVFQEGPETAYSSNTRMRWDNAFEAAFAAGRVGRFVAYMRETQCELAGVKLAPDSHLYNFAAANSYVAGSKCCDEKCSYTIFAMRQN